MRALWAVAAACAAACPLSAQQASGPQQPAQPPAAEEEKSLDELLGIGGDEGTKAAQESAAKRSKALKRILTEQDAHNALEAAIEGMRRSGVLLGEGQYGTAVQRVQEDVLARLDALIRAAEQQQQQQSSSSSSSEESSSSSQQQGQPSGGQRPGESAEQAAERRRREAAQKRAAAEGKDKGQQQPGSSGDAPGEPPDQVDPIEGGALSETDAEWGSLPPRTRDLVQQGARERMSSVYRRWTEAYYKRIAEESRK